MDVARAFNREKMQWLNAVSLECEVSSTAFRVAYVIADHHNRVTGFAWPSRSRLAGKVCLSSRTIQRAVVQLEHLGWLTVDRQRERSNHYLMSWPPGRKPTPTTKGAQEEDKAVQTAGQTCLPGPDKNGRQTYSNKYPRTFSRRSGEGSCGKVLSDQRTYEMRIVEQFGPGTIEVLQILREASPTLVKELHKKARCGTLTQVDIEVARHTAARYRYSQQS